MRIASIFAILRPFKALQQGEMQSVAAAAFSGLFWPLWSVLALAQRQSAESRPSPRFWTRFALMEYFNPRMKTKSQPPSIPNVFAGFAGNFSALHFCVAFC